MEKVVVFDFDKTLTNYDTTLPFFLFCCKSNPLRYLLIVPFVFIKIATKYKFFTVRREKEIGIKWLCPKNYSVFKQNCEDFSKKITLNNIYYTVLQREKYANSKIIIASASFEDILKPLFPEFTIIGTTLSVDNKGNIITIKQHPFGVNKAKILKRYNIDCFYTDSPNDIETTKLAKKTFWVKKGKIFS